MKEKKQYNMNDYCYIKLSNIGKKTYLNYYFISELATPMNLLVEEYERKLIQGYLKIQLHEAFRIFGGNYDKFYESCNHFYLDN